jgi:thioesterase domain-containing protein/aryl carrier-like protein
VYPEGSHRRVVLPTYPFQRERFWALANGGKLALVRARNERRNGTRSGRTVRELAEPIRAKLTELVQEAVGSQAPIGPHENLIGGGVDSLRAMQLLSDIRHALGAVLTPAEFGDNPTVAGLEEAVVRTRAKGEPREPAERSGPRLVAVRPGGDGTPLICFHPAGGHVTPYIFMGNALSAADRPVIAVQSRALGGDEDEYPTVGEMSRAYADLVREHHPGNVELFGWSLGGVVAHAVAAMLESVGVRVEQVGMVDPPEPATPLEIDADTLAVLGIVRDHDPDVSAGAKLRAVAELASVLSSERLLELCESTGLLRPGATSPAAFAKAQRLYRAHARLVETYHPTPVAAPLSIWWASRRDSSRWLKQSATRVRTRVLGGSHYTIVRPPRLTEIARELTGSRGELIVR